MHEYDSKRSLVEQVAELYGLNPKNGHPVAKLNKEAKEALGIQQGRYVMKPDEALSVWQWHVEKLSTLSAKTISELSTESEPDQESELSAEIIDELRTKPGRPRKYENNASRMKAYRAAQKRQGKAVLLTLDFTTHRHIKILAKAWKCSASEVIARWGKELEAKYEDILYPEGGDHV